MLFLLALISITKIVTASTSFPSFNLTTTTLLPYASSASSSSDYDFETLSLLSIEKRQAGYAPPLLTPTLNTLFKAGGDAYITWSVYSFIILYTAGGGIGPPQAVQARR
jgi:hypothetical protein